MMSKYIEREKIGKMIDRCKGLIVINAVDVSAAIDELPAADVAPVVHGRWLKNTRFKEKRRKCSECGFHSEFEFNYCPNCGAKMDGEGGNHERET